MFLALHLMEIKVSKGAKIWNQNNQVYQWESDKLMMRHHKQERRGQPFPSRCPQSTKKNRRAQKHNKHKTEKNINDPQKKYRLGKVSNFVLLDVLTRFYGANLTLNSDVDKD